MRGLAFLIALSATTLLSAAERPNVLFFFADDWGRYAGCYANLEGRPSPSDVIATPNIDRIAKNGVLFRNAFVNAPSCTPCRSALLSGRYFFATGRAAILQGAIWDPAIPSFPLLMRDAGYHIGETYKVWSPGDPVDAPFGAGEYRYESAGSSFNGFSQTASKLVAGGTSVDEAKDTLLEQARGNFGAFMKAKPEGTPFLYWFGPTNVHRKWIKGSGKDLWGLDPDDLKGKLPAFLPDVPEIRQDFADYLGEAMAFDAAVGEILKQLEEAGELENTLIVVSGDHGAPGFPGGKCNLYDFGVGVALAAWWPGKPGGRVVDDFVNLMDLAPTFLEAAGLPVAEGMQGRSLVPVLESNASGLVDEDRTFVVTGRERHVGAAREGFKPYPQRALRTKDYLYIINFEPDRWPMGDPKEVTEDSTPSADQLENNTFAAFGDLDASPTKAWLIEQRNNPDWKWHYDYAFGKRPPEELYDLRKDPDQIKNLAEEADYAQVRSELQAKLMAVLEGAGDPRVTGDGMTFERSPFTDEPPQRKRAPKKGKK
jgi:arylsulfatase A-like enzyme